MAIISKIYIVLRMILTVLLFGESSVKRLYVSCEESERAVCPLPTPCYRWVNLNGGSCDLGTEIQPDNTATGIDACPSWFRGFRYYPYQFDLLENVLQSSDGKILDVIALSRCTRRPFGAAPERQDAVAVLRGPNIGPAACTVWRVTFWYRLSDYPVFDSANPQNQFYLKVFVENNGETFPSELIWGREEDYDEFRPNVWYSGEGVFHRDQSEPFALYWFAYHNDNCDVDLKEIAVDSMRIQYATSATPASGICPTTTVAPPQTTPPSTPTPVIPDTTPTTTPSTTTTESPTTTRESPTPTEIVDSTTTPDTTTVSPEPDPDTPSIDTTESTPTPSTATPSTVTDAPVSETTPSTATAILDANTTAPAMTTATVSIEPGTEMNTTSITATASIETNTTSTPTESTNSTVPITSLETAPPGNITATTPSIATPITTTTNGTSPSSPTTTPLMPVDLCKEVDCGFGQCSIDGASYACECRHGFVQDHPRAVCRCPATTYHANVTSGCVDAPLIIQSTYQLEAEFPSDLSNNNSEIYMKWSSEIERKVRDEIAVNFTLGTDFTHLFVRVLSFRNGSVVTDVLVTVAGYQIIRETEIRTAIENIRPSFEIDGTSLMIVEPIISGYFNRCIEVEENSACGAAHRCNFAESTGKATCHCNPGYEFDATRKLCNRIQIVAPTSTPSPTGNTDPLYIALYTIAAVTGTVVIVFAGLFARRRYVARRRRPLPPVPPIYQARTNRTYLSRQQQQDAVYASIADYGGINSRRQQPASIRSTTSSMPDYDLDVDELERRRSSGYSGSMRSLSSFHPSEQSYELYGVVSPRSQRQH